MKYVSLDLGDARIGIAASDPLGILATGIETYRRAKNDEEKDLSYLSGLIKARDCDTIVVGVAVNLDGTEGERARMYREFGEKLREKTGIPVVYEDEKLTTCEAHEILIARGVPREKRKEIVDLVAAELILQSYLDKQRIKQKKEQIMSDEKEKNPQTPACDCDECKGVRECEEDCDCDECEEDCDCDDDLVTLTDDEGNDIEFYQVATLDYGDKWYTFLEPIVIPEGFEEGDLAVFELGEDKNGEEVCLPVEDEKLLEALFAEFDKLIEEYGEDDEEDEDDEDEDVEEKEDDGEDK